MEEKIIHNKLSITKTDQNRSIPNIFVSNFIYLLIN